MNNSSHLEYLIGMRVLVLPEGQTWDDGDASEAYEAKILGLYLDTCDNLWFVVQEYSTGRLYEAQILEIKVP